MIDMSVRSLHIEAWPGSLITLLNGGVVDSSGEVVIGGLLCEIICIGVNVLTEVSIVMVVAAFIASKVFVWAGVWARGYPGPVIDSGISIAM